jgi:plasmid stability protein
MASAGGHRADWPTWRANLRRLRWIVKRERRPWMPSRARVVADRADLRRTIGADLPIWTEQEQELNAEESSPSRFLSTEQRRSGGTRRSNRRRPPKVTEDARISRGASLRFARVVCLFVDRRVQSDPTGDEQHRRIQSALLPRFPSCWGAIVPRLFPSFGGSKRQEALSCLFATRQDGRRQRGGQSGVCLPAEQLLALLAAGGDRNVAQLMVRNVDEAVVRELKKRAARRNHSAEQEHREILEQALLRPRRRSLAEVLAAMPDAGEDADFERRQIDRRA